MVAFGKIKAIMRRTGVVLTVDEVHFICEYMWHCQNQDEFYRTMDGLSDAELKEVAIKAKLKKKPGLLEHEQMLYA